MTIVTLCILLAAGWMTGALINLLADQLPVIRRVEAPVCGVCEKRLGWLEYIFLEQCGQCGAGRSARSHTVQWLMVIGFLAIGLTTPVRLLPVEGLIVLAFFTLVFVIDLEHRLILQPVSLAGALIGGTVGLRLHGLWDTIIGGAAGFGIMLCLYFMGEFFARAVSKRRGQPVEEVALGFGDVTLSGVLGLMLGWPGITAGLLFAILAGGLVSAFILARMWLRKQYQAFTAVPYAPFLILSAAFLLFRP